MAAVLALFVVGCVHYESKPLTAASGADRLEARTFNEPGLRRFVETNRPGISRPWPLPVWELTDLTLAAYYFHPDLEIARAKLAGAEAAVSTAGARPNPTAGFSPTYDTSDSGGLSPWTLGFALDVPIETAGKRDYRLAQAQHTANASRLNFASAAWSVRSRVHRSMVELQGAKRTQEILAEHLGVENQTLDLLEARLKAGESSMTDVQFVRVAASQTALQLISAENESTQARIRLANALGVPASAMAGIALAPAEMDRLDIPADAAALRREALLNRADVLGALADYDASESALQLEIAKQYPDIHLGPGYAWDQGQKRYSLGFSFALPVFDRNQGPIAEAEAHRRQAAAGFNALQARVVSEVELALVGYRDALRKLDTAGTLIARHRERLKAAEDALAAGAIDRVEVLQLQSELGTSELARAAASNEVQLAMCSLEDAMQRPVATVGATEVPVALLNLKIESP